MLSKGEINLFFSDKYDFLVNIAQGVIYKNSRRMDPATVISESFIYIDSIRDKINTIDELQRYTINFINMNIIWTNSKINKQEKSYDQLPQSYDTIDEDGISDKLEIEKWYTERKCLLDMYRNQESDKVKRIIFDVYYKKGIIKGSDMAKHLNINKDYACRYIREMKKDIRDFKNNLQDGKKN